jgi:uncharacterized LabA/DUF88 family protein
MDKRVYKVAVLIDGSFFLHRYFQLDKTNRLKTAEEVADEIYTISLDHVGQTNDLYRIYFYDCYPLDKKFHNPVSGKVIDFSKEASSLFRIALFERLKRMRKVALRLGYLRENKEWIISPRLTHDLLSGKRTTSSLAESDLRLDIRQKGVDMKIGVDIATLAYKKLVDRIILIAGDADFVPASKLARLEGIDFILDPLWNPIDEKLLEHVDGIQTLIPKPIRNKAA